MSRIHIDRFLGIAPKLGASVLDGRQAQKALNAKLWSEKLRPIAGSLPSAALSKTGDIQTIYLYNGGLDWLHWTQDVNAVPGPIAGDELEKLYFTGTDKPRVTTNALFDDGTPGTSVPPASWILGIPAPTSAPVAANDGAGNITATSTWVMTFVRKYSDNSIEEGPPSAPSNSLISAANKVDVSLPDGTMASPGDYGITHKRLYRNEGQGYFFVTEQTFATTTYEDNIATAGLGDLIESTDYAGPPDGMVGLIVLPNGITAGFKGNVVYLSEPYKPHAYPERNQYAINWPIVGLGAVGTSIVVITSAFPYIGRGVDPAAYSFKRHPGRYPCTSKRGIVSGDIGVLWPTPNGMALCDGVNIVNATAEFITKDEWGLQFYPSTIHGHFHAGRYYGFFENGEEDVDGFKLGGGFILDRSERAFLTTIGQYQYAAYAVPDTDKLYTVRKNPLTANANHVFEWEADPSNPLAYEWKSKLFISHGLENFAFAQVFADYGAGLSTEEIAALQDQIAMVEAFNDAQPDTDGPINGAGLPFETAGFALNDAPINADTYLQEAPDPNYIAGSVTFSYWVDGDLKLERLVEDDEPFPLPSGFLGEKHEIQLAGAVAVDQVTLATSVEELATV